MSIVRIALCGDVMLGRGVDQIMRHPGDARLHERYATSALDYVELAERAHGPIPRNVAWEYVWGDALEVLRRAAPDAFIVNLETAITTSGNYEPKGINYRMHPANTPCLSAAGVDCCVLANNHLLDWGEQGLADTLRMLAESEIAAAGAGLTQAQAAAPAVIEHQGGRILVFAFAAPSSGVPEEWAAGATKPGVAFLGDLTEERAAAIADQARRMKRPGDVAIASIHWGSNWGYGIPREQRRFAHAMLERGGIDVVYGHSSHHPRAAELYRGRSILYGCGDFLNDYEGISGHESFRGDIAVLYLLGVERRDGRLAALELAPFRIRKFRLTRLPDADFDWLFERLGREYERFGLVLDRAEGGSLAVTWDS